MNEKKWKDSQKKLVKQRDEALALVETMRADGGRLPAVQAELTEMTSARDGLRAEVGRLESTIDHLDKEKERFEYLFNTLRDSTPGAMAEVAEKATAELKQQFVAVQAELSSLKMEDVKQLRRRLQTKTEKEAQLTREVAERDRLLGALMRLPAVRAFIEDAKKRAAAAEAKATEPQKVPNPDNANGAADQPSFPAPVEGAAP